MTPLTPTGLDKAFWESRTLRAQIKALEEKKRTIDKTIMDTLLSRGKTTFRQDEGSWAIQIRTTSTIAKDALVARGVDPDTIAEATTTTVSTPYLTWRAKKGGKKAEE